jgi:di/tripeptidase
LRRISFEVVKGAIEKEPVFRSSSTDCNIPLSLGIPSICVGVYDGGGQHTREEWVRKQSLIPGLEIAIRMAEELT